MRRLALLGVLAAVLLVPLQWAAATPVLPGSSTTVTTPSGRAFVLVVPDDAVAPLPLVVALHGLGQTPEGFLRSTGLAETALRERFLLAVPAGVSRSWHAGTCCGASRADDVAFLEEVVETVARRQLVDATRVHAAGYSNGGMMSLRWACASTTVASVVVVGATRVSPCDAPPAPVPVLALHGALDRTVPLEGARSRVLGVLPPVREALEPFARTGAPVELRVSAREGHRWLAGASDAAWTWFAAHPRAGLPLPVVPLVAGVNGR